MKVIYMPVYQTVIYAGEELVVPDWVKFIATNSDGGIWGYSQQPIFLPNTVFDPKDKGGKWWEKNYKTILGYAQLVDTAPENTLVVLSNGERFPPPWGEKRYSSENPGAQSDAVDAVPDEIPPMDDLPQPDEPFAYDDINPDTRN